MRCNMEQTDDNTDLMRLFAYTDLLIRRFHHWKHDLEGSVGSPHHGQGRILCILKKCGEVNQNELSEMLGIRQQSLGELLGKLEKSGYITREPADDRRTMRITITPGGVAVVPAAVDANEIFGCLNEQEQEQFRDYLQRIAEHMRQTAGEGISDELCNNRHNSACRDHHHDTEPCTDQRHDAKPCKDQHNIHHRHHHNQHGENRR